MPSGWAGALEAQVVEGVNACSVVGTRVGLAWLLGTSGSAVGWLAPTGETRHAVHTGSVIQTGAGRTLVYVFLTQITYEG